jgi:hypothetical protein
MVFLVSVESILPTIQTGLIIAVSWSRVLFNHENKARTSVS